MKTTDTAALLERATLAAAEWATSNTPIAEALAYRDGFAVALATTPQTEGASAEGAVAQGWVCIPEKLASEEAHEALAIKLDLPEDCDVNMVDVWDAVVEIARRFNLVAPVPRQAEAAPLPDDKQRDVWELIREINGGGALPIAASHATSTRATTAGAQDKREVFDSHEVDHGTHIEVVPHHGQPPLCPCCFGSGCDDCLRTGADLDAPSDCSGDPTSCPDNEGRGCYCSDKEKANAR